MTIFCRAQLNRGLVPVLFYKTASRYLAILFAMVVFLFSQNEAYAAVAYGSSGNVATGTTSLSVPYPASIAAGNLLVLVVGNKYPANGPTTPVGWTLVAQGLGGLGSAGNDSGQVYATVFVKVALGTESGNLAITLTSANTSMARMFRYTKAAGTTWDYAATTGSDGVADKSWSVTGAANPGIISGDVLIVGSSLNGNLVTSWTESILATGATIGAGTERNDSTSGSGNDMGLIVSEHPVTAGTAAAAPVYSMTGANGTPTTNSPTGASVILRIREVPPLPAVISIAPNTGSTAGGTSVTITGTNFTGATVVTIGGAAATSVVVVSAISITAVTPAGTTGAKDVVVTTPGGSGTGVGLYTYVAPAPAICNTGTISGIVNTYYPVAQNLSAGATSIVVGTSAGNVTQLAQNDLVLIMQMQDAVINTLNTNAYGANDTSGSGATAVAAGKYEYATVASVAGTTVTLTSGLVNAYTYQAGTNVVAQKTIQMIRIPVFSTGTLTSTATALAWNGSTGGVLAFDVTGALTLAGATADVSGKGFRGGAGRSLSGAGSGTSADYRTLATNPANGSKGEGIAGSPRYVNNAGALLDTAVEGYPGGSYGKGAPANAGGGGTDDDGASNDENTGGGGGANGGKGGMGGYGWSAPASPGRGIGGAAVSSSASLLVLGGGAGAASTNNSTGTPGGGFASSGAAGGGLIMVRAGSLTGTGTFNVSGANANNTITNDGSGGGGAAGSVMVYASSGIAGLTVTANGGTGGTNTGGGSDHGPGGGGGGGYAITSAALAACNVNGGASGTTYLSNTFGATPGSPGICSTTLIASQMPGATLGSGPCVPSLNHYTISHSGTGITCEAEPVTFTAHNNSHARADANGKTISISTSTSSGTWLSSADSCTRTCFNVSGTAQACANSFTNTASNNGTASYVFGAGESGIRLCLKQNSPVTQNINVSDGAASENTGTSSAEAVPGADPDLVFGNTGIRIYADGNVDTIASQIAGVRNDDATNYPGTPQVLTVRALKSGETTPARCVPLLTSVTRTLQFAYRCDSNPSTCSPSLAKGLEVNGTKVTGVNAGTTPAPADGVSVIFDTSGYGSINLKYFDVGNISLWAQATSLADSTTGSTFAVVTGNSNTFAVKPYDFGVIACTGASPCAAANASPTDGTGPVFAKAGAPFMATITARALGGSTAYSFGRCDGGGGTTCTAASESINLSSALAAPSGGAAGTLGGTVAANASNFVANNGAYTFTNLSWDEVGVITLKAANANYLSNGFGVCSTQVAGEKCQGTFGSSGNVGRFIPDHFDTVVTQACATGGYTYSGQPFTLSVTARNLAGATTKNYDDAGASVFSRAHTLTDANALATPLGGFGATNTVAATAFVGGEATVATPVYTYADANRQAGPSVVKVHTVDTDGVTSAAVEGITNIRGGRVHLANAYGSERLDLPMSLTAEYWNGFGWVINAADSCTTGVTLAKTDPVATDALTPANVSAWDTGSPGVSGIGVATADVAKRFNAVANAGSFNLKLMAPGVGVTGAMDITATVPAWLQYGWTSAVNANPVGRASFGVFKSPLIYRRENY